MHQNIKTVAGCLTRVTCNISAPQGVDTTLRAYLVYEGESRPATMESADVIIFPAVPYGHYAYEIRCGGKPVAFGHLLVRASAFPHTDGVVDYALGADLSETEALSLSLSLTPGPRGPKGEDGVSEDAVASIVGSTFKLAVGSDVPEGIISDTGSIALGGIADKRSIAVGFVSRANQAFDTVALGYVAKAYGTSSVSVGAGSFASGESAIALGGGADAPSDGAIACGANAEALQYGLAAGFEAFATNDGIAIGERAAAHKSFGSAIGMKASAHYDTSTVLGTEAKSSEAHSLLLCATNMSKGTQLTLELLAGDLESVPDGNGEIGDPDVSFNGGWVKLSMIDNLAGMKQTVKVKMRDLFVYLVNNLHGVGLMEREGGSSY